MRCASSAGQHRAPYQYCDNQAASSQREHFYCTALYHPSRTGQLQGTLDHASSHANDGRCSHAVEASIGYYTTSQPTLTGTQ